MTGCSLYHRLRKGMVQMTIREGLERWEKEYLSPFATLSMDSQGRERNEEQCDIRPVFQRDRDRILHSKSFRRLKDKTQVFLAPEGDHYRTRLTMRGRERLTMSVPSGLNTASRVSALWNGWRKKARG